MLLSQVRTPDGRIQIVVREGTGAFELRTAPTLYDLAMDCARSGTSLVQRIADLGLGAGVDLDTLAAQGLLLPPILHPDLAHLHLTGTGLTHLGSASARAQMHLKPSGDETDSMKMFRMGVAGGKPGPGQVGVQPEWFYKGNGFALAAPGAALVAPGFGEDGGEEPEIAGVYVIGPDGTPCRLGFALANEFSDHVMERRNYLYLAHSKLRPCSFGPELLVGPLPADIVGTSRVWRGDTLVYDKPFLSGEANMSHTIANLEDHQFKYDLFRQPGDVHVHMFGTATISFADHLVCHEGDVFEIAAPPFGMALRNRLTVAPPRPRPVAVLAL